MIPAALVLLVQAAPTLILPGVLDLPLADHSTPMADCGWLQASIAAKADHFQCVTSTLEQADEVTRTYVRSAEAMGWQSGGGEANVLHLYRRGAYGACEELGLAVFPAGSATGSTDAAIILIGGGASNNCPAPSSLP